MGTWLEEMGWGADPTSAAAAMDDTEHAVMAPRARPGSWGGDKPDARHVLSALCAVHVRLPAPGDGAKGAAAHRAALVRFSSAHRTGPRGLGERDTT